MSVEGGLVEEDIDEAFVDGLSTFMCGALGGPKSVIGWEDRYGRGDFSRLWMINGDSHQLFNTGERSLSSSIACFPFFFPSP